MLFLTNFIYNNLLLYLYHLRLRISKHSGVSSIKINPLRELILPPEELTATSVGCRTREHVSPGTSICSITLPNPSEVLVKRASCSRSRDGPSGFYQGDLKVEWIYIVQWRHAYHVRAAYSHTAYCEAACLLMAKLQV